MTMIEITDQYLSDQGLSPLFPSRFWSHVDKSGPVPLACPELGPCWLWTAHTNHGYGRIYRGVKGRRMILAHNASWILHRGPIPSGKEVCHHCDNPSCVRPGHLWIGTHADNCRDRDIKGRNVAPMGEAQGGHKLTSEQVLEIRSRYASGGISQLSLARLFGVSERNVNFIVHRMSWKHI